MTERKITYRSTKTWTHATGLSCAFRQWRAESHCRYLHGYSLEIRVEFAADELDARLWVVDFGGLKSFKGWLETTFDHKTLVAQDDPLFLMYQIMHDNGLIQMVPVPATGCEAFARMVFECAEIWLRDNDYGDRVHVHLAEVKEHGGNSAIAQRA